MHRLERHALNSVLGPPPDGAPTFTRPDRITNPWLPLSCISVMELRGFSHGKQLRVVRRRLAHTQSFPVVGLRVETVAVENRRYEDEMLRESHFEYYAQADDGTVYQLAGGWESGHATVTGLDVRRLGVAMPACPLVGRGFVNAERAERSEVIAINARVTVPAGSFPRALEVSSRRPGEARVVRWYARGVGLIKERRETEVVELAAHGSLV